MACTDSLDCVPELDPNQLYELCPDCGDRDPILDGGCMNCWDTQLVPHACGDNA